MAGSRRRAARRRGWRRNDAGDDPRYALQFVGALVAIGAVMLLVPTSTVFYRWFHRADYSVVDVEVLSPPSATQWSRTIRVRELASGSELWVNPQSFDELMTGGTVSRSIAAPGQRFQAWFDPTARATAGIVLYDQRLVSRQRYPELATGSSVFGHALATLALAALAGRLLTAPYRPRRGDG